MSDNRPTDTTPKGVFQITADSVEVGTLPNSHHTLASEIAALFTHFIRRPQNQPEPYPVVQAVPSEHVPGDAIEAAKAAAAEIAAAKGK